MLCSNINLNINKTTLQTMESYEVTKMLSEQWLDIVKIIRDYLTTVDNASRLVCEVCEKKKSVIVQGCQLLN